MGKFDRHFRISIYVLAVVATLLLGISERTWLKPAMMAMAAVAAYVLTEREPKWAIPSLAANLLAVAAVLGVGWEIARGGAEYQLLGIAHLLVYLQLIVLFQRKSVVKYWQLAALGLFQVTVGGVMNLEIGFGLLIVVYLFVGLWMLVLFNLHREAPAGRGTEGRGPSGAEAPPMSELDACPPARASYFVDSTHLAEQRAPARGNAAVVAGLLGVFCLLLSAALFPIVPRVPREASGARAMLPQQTYPTQTLTGLGQSVQLGEIGRILESGQQVMEVSFVDVATGEPFRPTAEPLLRGMVLTKYSNGRWTSQRFGRLSYSYDDEPRAGDVRQEYELEPLGLNVLFAMSPIQSAIVTDTGEVLPHDPISQVLRRPDRFSGRPIRYHVFSRKEDLQEPTDDGLTPFPEFAPLHRRRLTQLPRRPLQGLESLSEQIVSGVPPEDTYARALALLSHLNDPGLFNYSLNQEVSDPRRDPVEDFLLNHRSGNCEYFASALALMLRSVDIPARVVSGFKGGVYNNLGGYYTVLQKHAHLWVEAFVAKPGEDGHWLTLDPTPGDRRLAGIEADLPTPSTWRQWFSFGEYLWSRHVVGFKGRHQLDFFKNAVPGAQSGFLGGLLGTGPTDSGPLFGLFGQIVELRPWAYFAAMVIVLLLVVAALWIAARAVGLMVRLVRSMRAGGRGGLARPRSPVEFYDRLERVLERRQLVRPPATTPGEFAHQVSHHLASSSETAAFAPLPVRVVEAFYRVRFGHEPMGSDARRELLGAVEELDRCFRTATNGENGR